MSKKLTSSKAKEILHDKSVHGHPLTDKQRKFFGAIASGAAPQAQNGIEGTMGGLTDKGFNYNPAWGGAWKNGGWMDKYENGGNLQPPMAGAMQTVPMAQDGKMLNEEAFQNFFKTLPLNLRVDDPSYNIRGYWDALGRPEKFDYTKPREEDGKYHAFSRHPKTGEILKSPQHPTFKMAIEGDRAAGYYPIMTPEGKIKTVSGNNLKPGQSVFAMGGSLPGATGMMYARTGDTPSEGPYAKKTLPSAQNGQEMSFYQHGLDWTPRNISKDGSIITKAQTGVTWSQSNSFGDWKQKWLDENIPVVLPAVVVKAKRPKKWFNKPVPARAESTRRIIPNYIDPESQKIVSGKSSTDELDEQWTKPLVQQVDPEFVEKENLAMAATMLPFLAPIAGTALGAAGITGSTLGTALTTPIAGVPGASLANLAAAYGATDFALNRATQIPGQIRRGEYVDALGNVVTGGLDLMGANMLNPTLFKNIGNVAQQTGKNIASAYDKVATGNSTLTDFGFPAWKVERPNFAIKSSDYIARAYTDKEAELLSKYGKGMGLTPEEWKEMEELTKSGATDFSKGDIPISRIPLYYNRSQDAIKEAEEINNLKLWQKYSTPSEKNIRTWSAGIGEGYNAERLRNSKPIEKLRLVIPSRYTKDLGSNFSAMPYDDPRVDFIYPKDDKGFIQFNELAAGENELMGNLLKGFRKIGQSTEGGFKNIIIKPIHGGKKRKGGVVKDDMGYWNPDNWGKVVEIDSPYITMKGVDQPLLGISDEGDVQYMEPGKDYKFKGKKVKEYPVAKYGVNQQDEKTIEHLDQLSNFTNYNKPKAKSGGWLDKYN